MECLQHHGPLPQVMFCQGLAELLYDLIIVIPLWACRAYKYRAVSYKALLCVLFEQRVINVLTKLRLYVGLRLKPWCFRQRYGLLEIRSGSLTILSV